MPGFDPSTAVPSTQFDPSTATAVSTAAPVHRGILDTLTDASNYIAGQLNGAAHSNYAQSELASDIAPFTGAIQHGMDQLNKGPTLNPLDWAKNTVQAGSDLFNMATSPINAAFHATLVHPAAEALSRTGLPLYAPGPALHPYSGQRLTQPQAEQQIEGDLGTALMGIPGHSDLVSAGAASLLDAKRSFDINQNLQSAGGGQAAPFIKNLFDKRGLDTTPRSDPRPSQITPMTNDHTAMNAADHAQYQQLLQTGNVDDIKNFFQGRQGPQPSWSDVNTWVEHRDGTHAPLNGEPGAANPEMQPDFNYNDQYNQHAENTYNERNRAAVEDHVNNQMAQWTNAPSVEVVHSPNEITDPQIREQALNEDTNGDALGFLGSDGTVRMFSGRITDPDTANSVLFHEGLGHFGLAQKFGDKLDVTLQSMLDRNVNQFSKDTDAWQKAHQGAYGGDRLRAAEEVLAERSQNGQVPDSWQNAVSSAVRQFGRKMGLKLAYSDAEVNHILAMSHDAVVNGAPSAAVNGFRGATQAPENKFMRNALGDESVSPEHLDQIDRLKQDPRFWSDPEFRKNVVELARTREPGAMAVPVEAPQYRTEAEARAGNKYITRSQLASDTEYRPEDLEGIYHALDEGYVPTTRTFEEDRQVALAAGFSPSQIKSLRTTNPGDLSTRLYRLQSAANMADMKISELNKKLGTPEWSEGDQASYLQVLADRNYLVTRVKGERSEIARALNVSNAARAYNGSTMDAVAELLRTHESGLAGLADDPTTFLKFAKQIKELMESGNTDGAHVKIEGVNKPYWEQYLNTFHMNMMLSALSTHVKAPIDMATGIARNVIEKTLAMPVGKVRETFEAMTGKTPEPGVQPAELANHLIGILKAVTDGEVYRQVAHAAKTGESSYVVNGEATPTQFANQFGATSNPRIPIISKPTDLISAQDTFFRSVEINAQLLSLGAREARSQLGPKATTSDIMTLGHTLALNPTPSLLKEAFNQTNRTLLLNDNPLNSIINKARTYRPGMTGGQRVMAFITSNLAPFIRVESNSLINRVIQRSPLGLIDPTGYTQSQLKAGGAQADIAMTKMLYGTVLIGMAWAAADKTKNYLTGNGPDNVDKYKEAIASGWRPNAVHENGGYNTGGELGMSVFPWDQHNKTAQMVASMRQAYEAGANQGQIGTGLKLALGSLFSNLSGMSWVSDIQPAVDAVRAHGTEGQGIVSSFASHTVSTWMPNGLNQIARLTDPVQRDTTAPNSISGTVANELESTVPGLRQNLPIKYSVYGTPLANGASLTGVHTWIPGLSGNGTTETHDPAEQELDRLGSLVSSALVTPVQKTIKLDDDSSKSLTPAEFENYQRVAGRAIVETVRNEMSTSGWHNMSDQDKVLEVRDIQTDMKKAAREALFNK